MDGQFFCSVYAFVGTEGKQLVSGAIGNLSNSPDRTPVRWPRGMGNVDRHLGRRFSLLLGPRDMANAVPAADARWMFGPITWVRDNAAADR